MPSRLPVLLCKIQMVYGELNPDNLSDLGEKALYLQPENWLRKKAWRI